MTNKYLNIKNQNLHLNKIRRILLIIYAILEYPFILTYSIFSRQIGMKTHFFSMFIGLKIFLKTGDLKCAIPLILNPLDSVRYGEFWFAITKIKHLKVKNYLDVSSPRLLPLFTYIKNNLIKIDVLNPDQTDLNYTKRIFEYMNVDKRVNFYNHSIDNNIFKTKSYDLITCMSVLEHIEEDVQALKRVWSLLKDNGSLILTVPCSKTIINEYTNLDEYKTVKKKSNDYLFWQRFYSEMLLKFY